MSQQLMISGITTYDDVRFIDSIVDEAEVGQYVNSARLIDAVLRDARIYSTLMTRIMGLLGKPLEFEAATPSDGRTKSTAQKSADDLEDMWDCMFPHDQLVELMVWGLMQGVGVAQILKDSDPWKLDVWHPWALTWDEYARLYYIATRDESRLYLRPDDDGCYYDDNGGQWVLFTPFGFGNSGRRCYLRCLHRLGNERQWSHRDRARFSEVFGQPIRLGIAPDGATKDERAQYKKDLRFGAEPVVVVSQGVEGKRWGLELVQANGTSTELFDRTLTQLDREIATLLLGQSQTTDGQAGLGANELAGEPVRLDVMKADAVSLWGCLREQFLEPYWEYAYGNDELAPWPRSKVDPPEDRAKKSLEFKTLIDGIAAAKKAGVPIDERELLEDYGIPMITEAEQAALEAERAAAVMAAPVPAPPPPPMPPAADEMPTMTTMTTADVAAALVHFRQANAPVDDIAILKAAGIQMVAHRPSEET